MGNNNFNKQEAALMIKNLNKSYSTKKKKIKALNNFSLKVKKGSMLALLGPNGAGKSTLINILAGITNKSSGTVLVNGYNIDTHKRESKLSIGVVPQELVMDPYFTPEETLNFQSGYYGLKKSDYLTKILLKKLKLEDKADAYVRYLSGGMKRRLMIAKAMVHSPPILILDEPTAGVDVNLRQLLWENIKELNTKGTTILITTHYLEEAESLCDEVAIIDKGNSVVNGNIRDLIKSVDKKTINIFLSNTISKLPKSLMEEGFKLLNDRIIEVKYKPSKSNAGLLINKVVSNNLKIKDVTTNEANLEDLFNKIVN
ncbi:MAG: multidrug ABC transporter ATP-binding protein [Rickettsiales bacterium]|nr:multidrug ABC transporter ATP-binding protein [Rickettsiales bacterium]|tara:strand:- start:87 stop:1028 length:942 start_codon:yes stop_codon:yes gene_type:complete